MKLGPVLNHLRRSHTGRHLAYRSQIDSQIVEMRIQFGPEQVQIAIEWAKKKGRETAYSTSDWLREAARRLKASEELN